MLGQVSTWLHKYWTLHLLKRRHPKSHVTGQAQLLMSCKPTMSLQKSQYHSTLKHGCPHMYASKHLDKTARPVSATVTRTMDLNLWQWKHQVGHQICSHEVVKKIQKLEQGLQHSHVYISAQSRQIWLRAAHVLTGNVHFKNFTNSLQLYSCPFHNLTCYNAQGRTVPQLWSETSGANTHGYIRAGECETAAAEHNHSLYKTVGE